MRIIPITILTMFLSLGLSVSSPVLAVDQCSVALKACEASCWTKHADATGARATCIAGCSAESVACSSKKGYQAGKGVVKDGYQQSKEAVKGGYEYSKEAVTDGYEYSKEAVSDGYEYSKDAVKGGYEATKNAVGKGVDATKDAYQSTKEFIKRQFEDEETTQ